MNFAHSEVATLDPNTMRTLCEEYVANNYIDPETSERLGVKRGLRNPDGTGVLAGLTNVCDVVGYKKDQEGHVIPFLGDLIGAGISLISFLIALPCTLVTIAVAWIYYRPLLGIGLLVVAAALIVFLFRKKAESHKRRIAADAAA